MRMRSRQSRRRSPTESKSASRLRGRLTRLWFVFPSGKGQRSPEVPPRPWNGESPGPEAIPRCYALGWPSLYDPVVESGTLQLRQDLLTLTAAIENDAVAIDRWRTIDDETSRPRDLRKLVARQPGAGVYPGHLDEQSGPMEQSCPTRERRGWCIQPGPDLHGRQVWPPQRRRLVLVAGWGREPDRIHRGHHDIRPANRPGPGVCVQYGVLHPRLGPLLLPDAS